MLRILLVEDEPDIALVTSMALRLAGHDVMVAGDGAEGLERALRDPPDLVITDFMMPRMNGLEMVERLREGGYRRPVILTTAICKSSLPAQAGYDLFIPKPYDVDTLLRAARGLLSGRNA